MSTGRLSAPRSQQMIDRFASPRDLIIVFAVCAFPIHVWATLNLLYRVPSWLKQYTIWDAIGITAYHQFFALVETAVIFLILASVGALLPSRLFRSKFVALASMVVLLTSLVVGLARIYVTTLSPAADSPGNISWGYIIAVGLFYLLSIAFFGWLIHRSEKLESWMHSLANRLAALSMIYLFFGVLSAIIVLIRNI